MPTAAENKILQTLQALDSATRNNLLIKTEALDTLEKILDSVEDDKIKLKVNKIWAKQKFENNDINAQMNVRNRGQSWVDEARADVSLIDKTTGKEVDRVEDLKVSNIPKMTDRGTYLVKGNEYQFTKQSRLKPGVYTRIQNNGEISSFFNVDKTIDFERGFNNNFKLNFDPERKLFTMGYGAKNIPLYNVLRAVGVAENEMKGMWGKDVYSANVKAYEGKDTQNQKRMYEAIFGYKPAETLTPAEISKQIKERLFATELDSETTKITLGKSFEKVDKGALLTSSKKILDIHRGEVEPDDRDSLIFKSFFDVEDHIREKLIKNSGKIVNNLKFKLGKTRNINKSISSQTFDPFVLGTITMSQLSNPPSQTNLMSTMGESSKITVMGEGGIGSTNQISDEARQISNSELGFIDPLHTPEGGNIGTTVHHTMESAKIGNDLYGTFLKPNGERIMLKPIELHGKVIAFPDEYDITKTPPVPKKRKVRVLKDNKFTEVMPANVDYIVRSPMAMFDTSANMIPFLDSIQGNRGLTASKMQEQALPLKHRDKPMYKIVDDRGRNLGKMLGSLVGTPKSPVDGEVVEVTNGAVTIKDSDGKKHKIQLYNNFPLNAEAFLHNTPLIEVGQNVKKGQLLADNNNTRDGEFALGTNLRVAYLPWKGYNFEDSTVVSESAAKKLTSEHLYGFNAKRSSKGVFSREKFKAYYPEELEAKQARKLDKDGVVKAGQEVEAGDVLIAHMEKRAPTADDLALGRLDKQLKKDFSNNAIKWEKDHKGIVTSVEKHGNSVTVNIKTEEPLKVADKLAGLHGNKHIVSKILPDEEMPRTLDGKTIDITMSPIGVSNRINTSQILEAAAGKITEKTGKQYEIKNFASVDNSRKIMEDLNAAGLNDKEVLIDPETGKQIKNPVATGIANVMKLEHKIDHKFSARYREGYDSNEQPISGGETGGKNLGRMEIGALLARGAKENLKEMFNIKGQRNDEFWKALEMGHMLPPPKAPFVWDKMKGMMRGAGINVEQEGKTFITKPMTDDAILRLSKGEIKRPWETYRKKDLAPMREGLFDPVKTGGMQGDHYTHFKLPEKVLNPITGKAAAILLDIPETKLETVLNGTQFVDEKTGKLVDKGAQNAVSGSPAVEAMLKKIDVDSELREATEEAKTATNSTRLNKLHRKIKYLKSLKRNNMEPVDYMIENILIPPPKFRPMFTMGTDGTVIMSDVNDLYQQAATTAETMKELKKEVKGVSAGNKDIENRMLAGIRGSMYQDMKAVTGLREPTAYLHKIKDKKGYVMQIDGGKKQTKEGFYQDKVINRRQDLVGRSTVILNPDLGGDQIGIPKTMATKLFQPFIMKELVGLGYSPLEAQKHIKDETEVFKRARQLVADKRLVIANRAPTLHRWNMTAFRPVMTDGKAIEMPAVVISKNFGGDFDGDAFQIHVPIGEKALTEAEKMLPSSDMLKTGYDTVLNAPDMDAVVGAWLVSKGRGGENKGKFANLDIARNAYNNREIDYSDKITIDGITAPFGMHEINSILPDNLRDYKIELNKNNVNDWIKKATKEDNGRTGMALADKIKSVGNNYSTAYGFTLGVSDTVSAKEIRDPELKNADRISNKRNPLSVVNTFTSARERIENQLKKKYNEDTMIGLPIHSGGGRGIENTSQILSAPLIVADSMERPIATPITKAYSEGLDTSSYWAAAHGARGGNIKKSIQSYKPGWMTNDLINSIYTTRIAGTDPVDDSGLEVDATDTKNLVNRYTAQPVKDTKGRVIAKRNELIGSDLVNRIAKSKIKKVFVQSPLTDPTPGDGISSWSYGIDNKGQQYKPGDNIGVVSAHTITEPSLDLTMKSFHTGGAFTKTQNAFDLLDRTLRLNKNIPNKGTLAAINGKVKDIKKSSIGGYDVTLTDGKEDNTQYVETGNHVTVKKGQSVKMGDRLSTGDLSAHDVLKYKGMRDTQKFLVDEVDRINDGKLDRRDIEVLVRGITNTTRIKQADGASYVPGDVAPLTTVEYLNKQRVREVDTEDSVGTKLNRPYDIYNAGTKVDDSVRKRLYDKGIKRVEVKAPSIKHEPFLSAGGIASKAATSEDWIARLSHNRIKDVMRESATQGWTSDISGAVHPLPQLAVGYNVGSD